MMNIFLTEMWLSLPFIQNNYITITHFTELHMSTTLLTLKGIFNNKILIVPHVKVKTDIYN